MMRLLHNTNPGDRKRIIMLRHPLNNNHHHHKRGSRVRRAARAEAQAPSMVILRGCGIKCCPRRQRPLLQVRRRWWKKQDAAALLIIRTPPNHHHHHGKRTKKRSRRAPREAYTRGPLQRSSSRGPPPWAPASAHPCPWGQTWAPRAAAWASGWTRSALRGERGAGDEAGAGE